LAAAKELETAKELENVKATKASSKWETIIMESSNNIVEDDDK
jgi:hypothetical protein